MSDRRSLNKSTLRERWPLAHWLFARAGGTSDAIVAMRGVVKKSNNKAKLREVVRAGLSRNAVGAHQEEVAKLALQDALSKKRKKIRRAAGGYGGNVSERLAVRRFAKAKARELKRDLVKQRRRLIPPDALTRERVPSPLLDRLDPERPKKWRKVIARRYRRDFRHVHLKDLNFLDSPAETIRQLVELSQAEREEINAYLDFEDPYCNDIGAFLVISEIWSQMSHVFRGGRMSPAVQKVLDAVGLRRELNIGLPGVRNHNDIWPFEIRRRRLRGTTQSDAAQLHPQGREQLNDQLIELIDNWLTVASENVEGAEDGDLWELSQEGKSNIANMVSEILDNAERHSVRGGDGDWSMAAFMAKRPRQDGKMQMNCYLAFLSVGNSIAETIESAPAAMKEFCEKYAAAHERAGQSRGTLLTIAALQDGITSVHDAASNRRGGTGLQDTLDFVGELGGAPKPEADVRVTIVSGESCIRLRHPILVGRRDGNGRRVQWCNEPNDPIYPPDREVAFDLPAHFAGTLVSVAFTLDPSLFVSEVGQDGHEDD